MRRIDTRKNKGLLSKLNAGVGNSAKYAVSVLSLVAFTAFNANATPNNPPTDISITSTNISELLPIGSTVGSLSTTDPDVGDTFTYTLVAGAGDDDNASFSIYLNKLQSAEEFNSTIKSHFSVRIATTDAFGDSYEKVFAIDVDHIPAVLATITSAVNESTTLNFTASDFENNFSVADGMPLERVKIVSLPSIGTLNLNGSGVNAGDEIAYADLANLSYDAPAAHYGFDTIQWNGADSLAYANDNAVLRVAVKRVRGNNPDTSSSGAISQISTDTPPSGTIRSSTTPSDTLFPGGLGSASGNVRNLTPVSPDSLGSAHKDAAPVVGIGGVDVTDVMVHNCYPNPFSQGSTIKYQLPADGIVDIRVFNSAGMEIKNLVNGQQQAAGVHTVEWNGHTINGGNVENGQYYYFITVKDATGKQLSTNSGVMVKMK